MLFLLSFSSVVVCCLIVCFLFFVVGCLWFVCFFGLCFSLIGLAKVPQPWLVAAMQLLAHTLQIQLLLNHFSWKVAACAKAQPVLASGYGTNVHSWGSTRHSLEVCATIPTRHGCH